MPVETRPRPTKPSIPLHNAVELANTLRTELLPYCERVWVGGSVRRRKEYVGDIELVCIPKPGIPTVQEPTGQASFMGSQDSKRTPVDDLLTAYLQREIAEPESPWKFRLNTLGRSSFGPKNKLLEYNHCPVDIFSGTWANFGMLFFVRTGDAEWIKQVMAELKRKKRHGHPYGGVGYVLPQEQKKRGIPAEWLVPEEERIFELLGWPFTNPADRTGQTAIELRRQHIG